MKNVIQQLDEHIAAVPAPLGVVPEQEPEESEDDLEEGVAQAHIGKIAKAMLDAPQLRAKLESALKKSKGVADDMDLGTAMDAAMESLGAHLKYAIPLALADVGVEVTQSIAGRARRGIKAVAKGKKATEALNLPDGDLGDLAEKLIDDPDGDET